MVVYGSLKNVFGPHHVYARGFMRPPAFRKGKEIMPQGKDYDLLDYGLAVPVRFYVSLSGSDLNSGTPEQPFATLEAAKNAVRKFKKNKTSLNTPVEVIIRGGVYYLNETLLFRPEDSGTIDAGITWRAAKNERVVLSGKRATRARFPNTDEQNPFLYAIDGSMDHIKLRDGEVKSSYCINRV